MLGPAPPPPPPGVAAGVVFAGPLNKNAFAGAHLGVPASPLEAFVSTNPEHYAYGEGEGGGRAVVAGAARAARRRARGRRIAGRGPPPEPGGMLYRPPRGRARVRGRRAAIARPRRAARLATAARAVPTPPQTTL